MGCLGYTFIYELQRQQNRAARIITWGGYEVQSDDLLNHLKLQKLDIRRNDQLKLCTLMYKVYHEISKER